MRDGASLVGWEASQINIGYGTAGFFLNATGLQWDDPSFGGWLGMYSFSIFQDGHD